MLNTTVVLTGVAPSGAPAVARRALLRPDAEETYAQPQYRQPYGQPQYQPQYGQLPRSAYGQQPAYGNPYYGQPQYAQPQYAPALSAAPRAGTSIATPMASRIRRAPAQLFPFEISRCRVADPLEVVVAFA